MDLELKKQINVVEQRLQYHFGSTLKGYEIPKGMPFMKEVLADIDKLCEMARDVNTSDSGLHLAVVNVPLPDDTQAFDAVTRLREELKDTSVDVNFADVNSWLMGVNWCKDFIKGNER